jgi:hypothetical protein
VRARYRENPVARQRALRNLSRGYDAQWTRADDRSTPSLRSGAASDNPIRRVQVFASRVAGELEGPVLLYSRRMALLREARHHGIRRFDANLIIAAVQERCVARLSERADRAVKPSPVPALLLAIAIQSLIFAAVGMLLLA